jgi:hypothetical protein
MQMRVHLLIMPAASTHTEPACDWRTDRQARCSGGLFDLASPHLQECMTRIITVYATFSEWTFVVGASYNSVKSPRFYFLIKASL